MSIQACPIAHENDLGLSAVAKAIRNDCRASADAASLSCQKQIFVNIFFDGTNNNLERDKKKVANPSQRSHTNVVVLFDACRDDPENGYYKFYVPGVGTPFPKIGERTESDAGKASGWGGESRIYWGMIQVLNSMLVSVTPEHELLVSDSKAGNDVKHAPLHISTVTDANYPGQQAYFSPLLKTLKTKLSNISRPKLTEVKLSVFGFSRGAAQARAFCTFMDKLCDKDGTLAGVKLTIQFVGLFDTVASVGLADAAPGFRGFGGYANGTLDIPDRVKRCTHFVAGHEIRKAFPLSSVRSAKKEGYPGNCHEVVYPGAHSDVGGGYGAGSQGKSMQGRSALLSQVPLRHMYAEARTYGVPLEDIEKLRSTNAATVADLELHPTLSIAFNAYHGVVATTGTVEAMLQNHMDAYRHWRRVACTGPKAQAALSSYQNASPQDREDMASSEREFQLEAYANQLKDGKRSKAEHNLYVQEKVTPPSEAVRSFFDQYVHDSHASFYMVGPVTDQDKQDAIAQARRKVSGANGGTSGMNSFERALAAPGVSVQKFPLMVDFDTQAIANAKGVGTGALAAAISTTRRESGPFIRYRMVYDDSRGAVGKVLSEADDISQEAMA